jgi:hypothetical protein
MLGRFINFRICSYRTTTLKDNDLWVPGIKLSMNDDSKSIRDEESSMQYYNIDN